MKIEIKNGNQKPISIKPLLEYLESINPISIWQHKGMTVEIDPTLDFKGNDALIRCLLYTSRCV